MAKKNIYDFRFLSAKRPLRKTLSIRPYVNLSVCIHLLNWSSVKLDEYLSLLGTLNVYIPSFIYLFNS